MIVILHPTWLCNQTCEYCVTHRGITEMSDDTHINAIDFVSHLPKIPGSHIEYHSNEPTLHSKGLDFYTRAESLLTDFGIDMKRLLASNTTSKPWLQDIDAWCEFLSKYDWAMNISLDGPEYIHDKYRGVGNWEKVISSIIKIKEYNIDYGIISVISDGADLNHVYDFFVDINENVQLNPTLPNNDMIVELCTLFDRWITDCKPIQIEPFSKIFRYFTRQYYTRECPNICVHQLVSIAPNGDVRPCGFFADHSDLYNQHIYGNVNNNTFDEIWYGTERQKMIEYVDMIPEDCMTCRWIDFCGTGCSYAKHAGADKCGYTKELLEHASWLGDN